MLADEADTAVARRAARVDPEPGLPAELSALGRRLVGLDAWPSPR